jgi:Icc protein
VGLGDAVRGIGSRVFVACGHTHGGGEFQVLENLRVLTGPAEYVDPAIQRIVDVE